MRHRTVSRFLPAALAALAVGCSTGAGDGCGGLVEPIPDGFTGEKVQNAAVVRISGDGFKYLNQNWQTLVVQMLPDAQPANGNPSHVEIPFSLPCMQIPKPVVGFGGDIFACDNGRGGPGTVGYMDGQCNGDDAPCPILLTMQSVQLQPASPNMLNAKVVAAIDATKQPGGGSSGRIYLDSIDNAGLCFLLKRMGCWAEFHSTTSGRTNETVSTVLEFGLDPRYDKLLTFDLPGGIAGFDQIESDDLRVGGTNRLKPDGKTEDMCDLYCSMANFGWVKGLIIDNVVKPQLENGIRDAISQQRCRACDPADPLLAPCPATSACGCAPGAADCSTKLCLPTCSRDSDCGADTKCVCPDGRATCPAAQKVCSDISQCVPRLLGVEQYINAGQLLSTYGADPSIKLETYAAAGGGGLSVNTGFQVGMMGGAKAGEPAPCVPDLPAPAGTASAAPDLQAQGPAGHHVGLGVSEYFLNRTVYEAHRSGAMCLNISTAQAAPLTAGLFKTFLPSLGVLAGSETSDAPMMVVLRPLAAPMLHIGEGTFDPVTKKPIDPLLTLDLTDVRIDFYAFIEGRYARLFTLAADIKLPLSLIVEGCPMTLQPALGDLKQMITIRKDVPNNAEILAEDPAALAQLIPMVLGMAEPMLASILKPVAIPDMSGFRLQLDKLQGLKGAGSPQFDYLGLYGRLGLAGHCESWGPKTVARLAGSRLPTREELRLDPSRPLPWPVALIDVAGEDLPGQQRPMEFAWRIDGGLWSTWFDGPRLEVGHPALLAQGRHVIEVRSRIAGEAGRVGAPQALTFVVDFDAPEVTLAVNRETGRIEVHARDNVSGAAQLRFAYRVGDAALSTFGLERPIDLEAVERAGGVEVQVIDELGNIGTARWRSAVTASTGTTGGAAYADELDTAGEGAVGAVGCSAAGSGLAGLVGLGLLPFALRRRRR